MRKRCNLSMSNCDHTIDNGMEDVLRSQPVAGSHFAWDFCGTVWFDGENFVEEVFRFHVPVEILKAPSLRELMTAVNDKYGYK